MASWPADQARAAPRAREQRLACSLSRGHGCPKRRSKGLAEATANDDKCSWDLTACVTRESRARSMQSTRLLSVTRRWGGGRHCEE